MFNKSSGREKKITVKNISVRYGPNPFNNAGCLFFALKKNSGFEVCLWINWDDGNHSGIYLSYNFSSTIDFEFLKYRLGI